MANSHAHCTIEQSTQEKSNYNLAVWKLCNYTDLHITFSP